MNPSVSHRRTTGADTLQIAAAWRIDVTGCSFTKRTLVGLPAPKSIPEFRTETSWPMPSLVAWPFSAESQACSNQIWISATTMWNGIPKLIAEKLIHRSRWRRPHGP